MYVSSKKDHWLSTVFSIHRSGLHNIRKRLASVLLFAIFLTIASEQGWLHIDLTTVPFQLVGLALGIFLGFRNNASYERFWEGRKLWGSLVNTSRSFSRNVQALLPSNHPAIERLILAQIAYVHSLREHLRDGVSQETISSAFPEEEAILVSAALNRPAAILLEISKLLKELKKELLLSDFEHLHLLGNLEELTNIQGGCERIKNTPIPRSYTILIHRIVALYVFFLPLGLVASLHYLSPIVVLIVAYTFLGLDVVGDELEEPFGTDPNDLPLTQLSTMIEINLRQDLGKKDLPAMPQPIDGFLS